MGGSMAAIRDEKEEPGVYTHYGPTFPNAIRRYQDAGIEASMRAVLDNLRPGKRGAVVVFADVETQTLKAAVYSRRPGGFFGLLPPGDWSFVGTLGWKPGGTLEGGAGLAYDW
jgi:hypothetical protein